MSHLVKLGIQLGVFDFGYFERDFVLREVSVEKKKPRGYRDTGTVGLCYLCQPRRVAELAQYHNRRVFVKAHDLFLDRLMDWGLDCAHPSGSHIDSGDVLVGAMRDGREICECITYPCAPKIRAAASPLPSQKPPDARKGILSSCAHLPSRIIDVMSSAFA
jgi:hypothetical protein